MRAAVSQDYDPEEEVAAIKLQALQRGRAGRRSAKANTTAAALTYGSSDADARKSLRKRESEAELSKAGGYATAAPDGSKPAMGEDEGDERAAARIQSLHRMRQAKRQRAAEEAERQRAATQLQAARRGHVARRSTTAQAAEIREKESAAATKMQTSMRGKAKRKEMQLAVSERKAAATKVQAVRRGQQDRRKVDQLAVTGTAIAPPEPAAPPAAAPAEQASPAGPAKDLRKAFAVFDVDSSGALSLSELKRAFRAIGFTKLEVTDEIFDVFDTNKVSFTMSDVGSKM